MSSSTKENTAGLPATPWGFLPPRVRALYISAPRRTGAWLAEAFASDSACEVSLEEAQGAGDGLARLRDREFDAVLVSHEPPELDAFSLLDGLRGGGGEEPLVVLGQASEQELAALAYEAGADAYVCVNTATTRNLLWIVARATERRNLIRENRRLAQAERHRQGLEQREADRLLDEQREMLVAVQASAAVGAVAPAPLDEPIVAHYRELLRAHVIMGSGNLAAEMSALAELLAQGSAAATQVLQMHVQVLEELVHGLGSRSARHVMNRADLLLIELLVRLAERYRSPDASRNAAAEPHASF